MPTFNITPPAVVHHMAALDGQLAPPNALEGVQASLQSGAAVIEVDINALAEDDYLLVHDSTLEGETNGQGVVAEITPEQARSLKIKHRDTVTTFPAALLSDVVRQFLETPGSTRLQLDFKNVIPFQDDEPLHRLAELIHPLGERVIVSSGADWQLRKLRKIAPWLTLGFDVMWYIDWQPDGAERDPRALPKRVGAYGYYDDHFLADKRYVSTADYLRDRCESFVGLVPDLSVFYIEHKLLVQSLADGFNWAETLHQYGILLDAWTMDATNPTAVQNAPVLLESGVDLFTSNTPKAMAALLKLDQERPSR